MNNRQIKNLADFIPEPNTKIEKIKQDYKQNVKSQFDFLKPARGQISHQFDVRKIIVQNPQTQSTYTSTSKNLNTSAKQSSFKNLKLKDYLHLRSIQKRKNRSVKSKDNNLLLTGIMDSTGNNYESFTSNLSQQKADTIRKSSVSLDTNSVLKQQIKKHIKEQIDKLNNLNQFISSYFAQSQQQNQTSFILFSILQNLKDHQNLYSEVAKKIINYESQLKKTSQPKRKYFWDLQEQLSSPAKMGLCLTSKAFQQLLPFSTKS